jgi:UDP-N-acetylglucosamine--N-acetylmuramyl-(pentapeptide) pyrophosphoryl-undecaprenol N-acetylglucosamine transferase
VTVSVLIAGGGTGGHLYPGVAVARELLSRVPDARVTFVGTAAGIEAKVIPREGLTLECIRSAGLKGKSIVALVKGLSLLPLSAWDAWQVISRRRPAVVIGVGGYSSGPVVALAALRGVPTMLMEQNATPGLTNRLLGRLVRAAAVTYDESLAVFGAKAFVAGNPVRPEFFAAGAAAGPSTGLPSGPPRVLVFGGSQGAHAINVAMVEAASALAAASPRVHVTHQTGERDLAMVRDGYAAAGLEARVEPFLYEMDREMREADLIVCRAGATTLAELTAAARPSILVPLPTATDDHQRRNAAALVKQGAARVVEQAELTGARLAREILGLAADPAGRGQMSAAAGRMARPDAARVIVDRVLLLAGAGERTASRAR